MVQFIFKARPPCASLVRSSSGDIDQILIMCAFLRDAPTMYISPTMANTLFSIQRVVCDMPLRGVEL